jgi:hypothetical protein
MQRDLSSLWKSFPLRFQRPVFQMIPAGQRAGFLPAPSAQWWRHELMPNGDGRNFQNQRSGQDSAECPIDGLGLRQWGGKVCSVKGFSLAPRGGRGWHNACFSKHPRRAYIYLHAFAH